MNISDCRNKVTSKVINLKVGDMFIYNTTCTPKAVFMKVKREQVYGFVDLTTGILYDATVHLTTYTETQVIKINDPELVLR